MSASAAKFPAIQIVADDALLDGPFVIELRSKGGCLHSAIEVAPGYRLVVDERGARALSLVEHPEES